MELVGFARPRKRPGVRRRGRKWLQAHAAPKKAPLARLIPTPQLIEVLKQIPYGLRQRIASLVWWDFFAHRKSPPELLEMVRDPVLIDRHPLSEGVPWLIAMGYSPTFADKRVQPAIPPSSYRITCPYV